MKNLLLSVVGFLSLFAANGQLPDTDIFICEMQFENGKYTFSKPINMTRRKGYDNQPSFSADGTTFYFVAINKDTTQSDIYQCDLKSNIIKPFTKTPTSEYSPQLTPNGKGLSVVRVDADSGQRFYVIPLINGRVAHHFDHTDSIGYYAWRNDSMLAMFILGEPPTLQTVNLRTGQREVLAANIGRCMRTSSDRQLLYYVDKSDSAKWMIKSYDYSTRRISTVMPTLERSEDFELLQDGTMLTGHDGKLYTCQPGSNSWELNSDFHETLDDFYRIVADPTGKRIALVAFTGNKP